MASISLSDNFYLDAGPNEFIAVRHGESLFNVLRVDGVPLTSGKCKDIPLTDKGKAQATALGLELLKKIRPGREVVICSSTADRAKTTADLIFQELSKNFKCERGPDYEGLLELGQGKWEGQKKDHVDYKESISRWKALSASEKFITSKVLPEGVINSSIKIYAYVKNHTHDEHIFTC